MTVLALLLAFLGFGSLALAMEKHHQDLLRQRPTAARRRSLRLAGWGGLLLSYGLTVVGWGAVVGSILWFGLLSLAAAMVLLLVSRISARPRKAGPDKRSPAAKPGEA